MLTIIKKSEPMPVEQTITTIYGQPGIGKSSLGFTADHPVCLDFDRGAYRAVLNRKDTVKVTNWGDVVAITPEDVEAFKTIIVDTAGRALDALTQDIIRLDPKLGRGGALTLQGFGQLKSRFIAWLKMLNSLGKDVVLLAHTDEQRSGDDIVERLDIQGGSKGEIYKCSDAMGRIILQANGTRLIDFSPRPNAFGKNPASLPLIEFPSPATQDNTLAKIIEQTKTAINKLSTEQQDAQQIIEEWKEALEGITEVEDLNTYLPSLRKQPQSIRSLAAKHARKLGFTYNPVTKAYEAGHATA